MAGQIGLGYHSFDLEPGEYYDINSMVSAINISEYSGVIHGFYHKQFNSMAVIKQGSYIILGEDDTTAVNVYPTPGSEEYRVRIKSNFTKTLSFKVLVIG